MLSRKLRCVSTNFVLLRAFLRASGICGQVTTLQTMGQNDRASSQWLLVPCLAQRLWDHPCPTSSHSERGDNANTWGPPARAGGIDAVGSLARPTLVVSKDGSGPLPVVVDHSGPSPLARFFIPSAERARKGGVDRF